MSLRRANALFSLFVLATWLLAAESDPPKPIPEKAEAAPKEAATEEPATTRGANLLGQADTSKGEGRRNENVQINLVDTNAARELNSRVGTTATIIEEFRPERGYYAAEYGNAPRNPVHVQAQRGAGVHGNLFWTHNNSVFTARSFFQVGSVLPARQNQFGGQIGTELWKGAFFNANVSKDRNRGNVNGNVLVPLLSERTPLTNDPATRAIVERLLGAYPLLAPNRPDIAVRALNTNSLQSTDTNLASGQLNQKLREKDTLVFRYGFTGQEVDSFQFVKGQNPNTSNKNHNARITWNRAWSPFTITDVSMGFDRTGTLLVPAEGAVGPVFLNGLQMLGPNSNIPIDRATNQFRYSASVQHRRGQHALSAGVAVNRQQYNGYESETSRPIFQFRDDFGRDMITNLRMGAASTYSQAFGFLPRKFRNIDLQVFAGDRWAVNNKLTLSYGVRWEPWTKPVDKLNLSTLPFNSDWNNLGGSFGFAYRLPKGVIHGAFGSMFGQLFPITYGQVRLNAPTYFSVGVNAPDITNPLKTLNLADLNGTGRSVGFDVDPELATPYSYQYNFSWENEVIRGWKLQLGYVGSRAIKLYHTYQLNRAQPVAGIAHTTATINDRRPDPTKFQRFYTLNASRAYYDAGRATLTGPRWQGASMNVSYWFSKSIDLGADYAVTGGGQERWGQAGQWEFGALKDQRGLSNFDQPHSLLVQGNWDSGRHGSGILRRLTENWNLTSVYLLKSGTPFTVDSGSDGAGFGNADGTNGDRPNIVDPSIQGRIVGNPDAAPQLLPRSAFAFIRAPLQLAGTTGRNTFRKGKIANLNAAVSRTWSLPSEWTMMLRAEAINLSNTPQFAEPGRSLTSPNFGQITNTLNDGRTLRFTLRLGF